MKQRELKQAPEITAARKSYHKPALKEFGTISELTLSGYNYTTFEDIYNNSIAV